MAASLVSARLFPKKNPEMATWRYRKLVNVLSNLQKRLRAQAVSECIPIGFRRCTNIFGGDLRRAISHPFDFHHVTHTRPRHFERLEEGSQNELISEFMAIRAAQRPQSTLQGIQVNDLGNTPSVKKPSAETRRHPSKVGNIPSPEGHLNFPVSAQTPPSSPRSPRGIRSSPSIENFSRPAPWSPTSPTSPPPRTSSRYALNYSRPAGKAKSKPAKQASGKPRCVPHGDKNSFLDFDRPTNEPHLAVTHAITTIDGSARSLKYTSLPPVSYDGGMDSGPTADLHHGVEQGIPSDVVSSTDLPLRHANSFATTRTVSRPGLDKFSSNDQIADKARPESPQPARTSRWEDVVDYCYEQAAEADCNFDWSQKTVYVDGDLESTDAPASEGHPVETLASPTDEQQNSPGNCESKPCARAFHLRGVPAGNKLYSRHTSKKSVTELEDCLSPFGRHQSSSEYRGYQHLPQTSSKHISNLYTARKDVSVDHHAYIQEQDDDDAELKLPVEHPTTLERCSSGGSTSFSGLRPLSNKYSSDGSLLSSTTSTIRTYRSSTSVGSLPELVHSHNNSQESVMVGRTSSTDSVSSVLQSIPSRATSAPQSPPVLDRANAESQQIACLSQVISSRVAASEVSSTASSTAPVSPAGLKETPCELAGKRVRAGSDKAKPKDVSIRKRSASAVTPGQRPPTRGSYSLFPNQQSLNRRA